MNCSAPGLVLWGGDGQARDPSRQAGPATWLPSLRLRVLRESQDWSLCGDALSGVSELQPSCPQVCTLQAPGPTARAWEPGLCQAGGCVPCWEGGEARKHRVLRAGSTVIALEPDAWKRQGQPASSGGAAGRKVITVRKQALDASRGFNPVHIPGGRAPPAAPRHAPHGAQPAQPGWSFPRLSDVSVADVCCVLRLPDNK